MRPLLRAMPSPRRKRRRRMPPTTSSPPPPPTLPVPRCALSNSPVTCHMLPAGGGTWSPPNGQAMRDVTPRTKLAATSLLQGALGYRVLAGSVVGQPARVADDPRESKKPKVEGFSSQAKYAAGKAMKRKAAIGTPSFVVVVVVVVVLVVVVVVVVVVVPNICVVQQLPALPALLTGRLPRPRSR